MSRDAGMDYGRLLTGAGRFVWKNKFTWVLGFLLSLGSVVGTAVRLLLGRRLGDWIRDPARLLADPPLFRETQLTAVGGWLVGSLIAFFLLSLGYWLVAAVAQGGLIGAARDDLAGERVSLRRALAVGRRYLGRFIAIDTFIFLPLFLVLLLLILLLAGLLVGLTYLVIAESGSDSLAGLAVAGGVCLLPLLCLVLPVSVGTAVLRTLAFRDIVLYPLGVRDSLRHTWRVVRRQIGPLLIWLGFLWGIQYLAGLALNLVVFPLGSLLAIVPLPEMAVVVIALAVSLLLGVIRAILYAFTAVAWTLAYAELSAA